VSNVYHRLTGAWRGDVLALAAGALLPLAFAPVNIFPLAVLAPALLFALWLNVSARRALWRGWLFGVGQFGVGVSWVYVAIHDFGYAGVPLAALLTALFVAFLALFPALLGYLVTRLCMRGTLLPRGHEKRTHPTARVTPAAKLVLVFPAAWTLFEWLRGWVLSGFPWLHLGYSQIDTPLAGLAPLLGVYGVSWATAASAGLVAWLALAARKQKIVALVMLAVIWGGAALLGGVTWTQPAGPALRASLIQGNIPQDVKWMAEQRARSLQLYAQLTRQHWDSDLIVWPEAALTVFYHQIADNYLAELSAEARTHGADLVIGLSVQDQHSGRYYNALVTPGAQPGFYFKRHLVPFGDYVPLQEWLRGLIGFFDLPMSGYSAGAEDQAPLRAAGYVLGASICYEDAFGEEMIRALPEAALLVNGTNNAWYGNSFAPHQHLQISRMRALETGRPMLRATTNGISAIIDAKGEITAHSPQFSTYVLTGAAQPMRGATPYVRLGNYAVLIIVLVSLVWPLWRARA